MNDDSDSSTPVMNSTEPKMFDRALHEHSRYAVMRKVARMLAPTRIPLTDDEDEEDDLESISGASDSESDDSEVAPEDGWVISKGEAPDGWVISEAETWNTADKMTADLDKACRSYSRHFSTTAENPDLYQHNRDLMLSKLAKFPDTPKQPFIHLTNTFTAMAVHYLYILNTFAMQTDDERERISEREDQIEDLENTIANLRERVRLFKEDARDVRKKERKTSDQRNPRLTSVETFELEKEIRYLRADVAKRDKTIAKRDDELADLKEIMHHRDEQNSKRVAEVKKDLQRYKDKALTVLEAKNGHIERLRTELIGIADGTISAEDSKLIAGERRGLETTRNSSIHPLRALM